MTDEEYVRSKWILVHCCDGSYRGYPRGTVLIQDVNRHWLDFDSFESAAEFTRQREEIIKDVQKEIEWVKGFSAYEEHGIYGPARKRILARLESALAELTKGMKP